MPLFGDYVGFLNAEKQHVNFGFYSIAFLYQISMADQQQEECLGRVLAYAYSAISHSLRDGDNDGKLLKNALDKTVPKTGSLRTSTIHITTEQGLYDVVGEYVKDPSLKYFLVLTLGKEVGIVGHVVGLFLFRHMEKVFIWYRNPNGHHPDQCEYQSIFTLGQGKNIHPLVVLQRNYNEDEEKYNDTSGIFILDDRGGMNNSGPQMQCENLSRSENKLEEITCRLGQQMLGSCAAWHAMYVVDVEAMLMSLPETSISKTDFISNLNAIDQRHMENSSLRDVSIFAYRNWNSDGCASLHYLTEIYGSIDAANIDMKAYSDAFDVFEGQMNKPRSLTSGQDTNFLRTFLTSTNLLNDRLKMLMLDDNQSLFFLQRCSAFKTGMTFSKYIVYSVMLLAACKVRHLEEPSEKRKKARLA